MPPSYMSVFPPRKRILGIVAGSIGQPSAVVRGVNHDSVLRQSSLVQCPHHAPHAIIQMLDQRIVANAFLVEIGVPAPERSSPIPPAVEWGHGAHYRQGT